MPFLVGTAVEQRGTAESGKQPIVFIEYVDFEVVCFFEVMNSHELRHKVEQAICHIGVHKESPHADCLSALRAAWRSLNLSCCSFAKQTLH